MTEPVTTPVNVAAGATAISVSAGTSLQRADSLYRASLEQVITGNFDLILSDVLGLISIAVLLLNLFLTLRRDKKKNG